MESPRDVFWYIEGREHVAHPEFATAEPQSMGSVVAIELETQAEDGVWKPHKYL